MTEQPAPPPPEPEATCESRTIFWPGVEDIEADCVKPAGHEGLHGDGVLGEWGD